MNTQENKPFEKITIETTVNVPIEKVWEAWNKPEHIVNWSHASADWSTPYSENDLRVGGKIKTPYADETGNVVFVFEAEYTAVDEYKHIAYTMGDGRKVVIDFAESDNGMEGGDGVSGKSTHIVQTFDAETENTLELQRDGWSAILKNFKNYTESL